MCLVQYRLIAPLKFWSAPCGSRLLFLLVILLAALLAFLALLSQKERGREEEKKKREIELCRCILALERTLGGALVHDCCRGNTRYAPMPRNRTSSQQCTLTFAIAGLLS